jgi:hypothetical protein
VSDDAIKSAGLKLSSETESGHFRKTFGNPPELQRRLT